MSETISNLEEQIGVKLFDRSGRYPKLTPAGLAMLGDARSIIAGVDLLKARAKGISVGLEPELSVVVDVFYPIDPITQVAKEFRQKYPGVSLRIYVEALGGAIKPVLDGRWITRPSRGAPLKHEEVPSSVRGTSSPDPDHAPSSPNQRNGTHYAPVNFSLLGIRPDPSRFYDREYEPVLRNMVESALKHEAPIYEDVLVARIARAHGFQRSGDRIQSMVSRVLGRRYRKTHEDGRAVLWAENSPEGCLVSYRESRLEVRSHADIPIAELASLALPFIRVRLSDEDILYRMASHFQLGRLGEPTRPVFNLPSTLPDDLWRAMAPSPDPISTLQNL